MILADIGQEAVQQAINALALGSTYVEEKSYEDYRPAV